MIIVSSRKFRDSQNTYFEKAMTEEVILQTLHHGSFRLVPIREGDSVYSEIRKASEEKSATLVANFKGKRGRPRKHDIEVPSAEPQTISQEQIADMVRAAVQDALASMPARTDTEPVSKPAVKAVPVPEPSVEEYPDNGLLFSNLPADATVGDVPFVEHPEPVAADGDSDKTEAPAESVQDTSDAVAEPADIPSVLVEPAAEVQAVKQEVPPVVTPPGEVPRHVVTDDGDDHEPIPEPSDEVKRHMVPDTEASESVRPDFVDPGLYDDDDDSYIVGDNSDEELKKQLEEFRRQQNRGFFKRLFRK